MKLFCEFTGLNKNYADTRAVNGVSGKIQIGDSIALLGPNGGGKSTLLGLLGGIYKADAGKIFFPEKKPVTHIVSHHSQLYSRLSVRENLRYFASLYSVSDKHKIEQSALATGIAGHLHKRAEELSRGLLQRAILAVLLLHDPEFLLLDEAFTGLDTEGQILLERIITRTLPGFETLQCKALIITDHDFSRALLYSNRLMLIKNGVMIADKKSAGMNSKSINDLLFGNVK